MSASGFSPNVIEGSGRRNPQLSSPPPGYADVRAGNVPLMGRIAAGLPIEDLRGPGRAILHGEQAFEYHRWPEVGDVLEGTTTITDVYEKERSNGGKLEFYVTETDWRDAKTQDPVVTAIFTLVINVRPPKAD